MNFNIDKSIEILSHTPFVIDEMLRGLSDEWLYANEGPDTWSPYDILGHLIHGEKTDWLQRTLLVLENNSRKFVPFEREAQLRAEKKPISDLLNEFRRLRKDNVNALLDLKINNEKLSYIGIHPSLGEVTLSQLLSTWVVHDLNHIAQIARVLAKQYKNETGPWIEYLPVLTK